jgi:acid phosphatase
MVNMQEMTLILSLAFHSRIWRTAAAIGLAASLVSACAERQSPPATPAAPAAPGPPAASSPAAATQGSDENLHAILWQQTSLEYRTLSLQSYKLAAHRLDAALTDRAWTAALEQQGDAASLPPSVILDIDETVLDNVAYGARLILGREEYSEASWAAWVKESRATAVPGALDFARYAAGKGVRVFYVTNRRSDVEAATRQNLSALGFPIDSATDTVLTRGERGWTSSDKTPRRQEVAKAHRVLLLIGDDLGDFVPSGRSLGERAALE